MFVRGWVFDGGFRVGRRVCGVGRLYGLGKFCVLVVGRLDIILLRDVYDLCDIVFAMNLFFRVYFVFDFFLLGGRVVYVRLRRVTCFFFIF